MTRLLRGGHAGTDFPEGRERREGDTTTESDNGAVSQVGPWSVVSLSAGGGVRPARLHPSIVRRRPRHTRSGIGTRAVRTGRRRAVVHSDVRRVADGRKHMLSTMQDGPL